MTGLKNKDSLDSLDSLDASSVKKNFKINVDGVSIHVKRFNVESTITTGESPFPPCGPVIAVLKDKTVLLGGGQTGGSIYAWNEYDQKLKHLGDVISANKRVQADSRFKVTDIAVLCENKRSANLLISFPILSKSNCVKVVVIRFIYDRMNNLLKKKELWFKSSPCVKYPSEISSRSPFQSPVQHASGRIEVIDKHSIFLTLGDLGFDDLFDRKKRGDLGSVFRITKKNGNQIIRTQISQGHRNMQGVLLLNNKHLLVSEHGPKGGDELNLIDLTKPGVTDFGWPFVSYGTEYTPYDYVTPRKIGRHEGFANPIKVWETAIAPTELVQVPNGTFGKYSGGIAMGTLLARSLVFMRFKNKTITDAKLVNVRERIRDLDVLPDKRLIASTDSGQLLIFSSQRKSK
jgi:hypothetical protein